MSEIPAGYRLTMVNPTGEIFYNEELEGFDLTKSVARNILMGELADELEIEVARLRREGSNVQDTN